MSATHKACPFCGKDSACVDTLNYTRGLPGRYRIQCANCLAKTQFRDSEHDAWRDWDTRPELPAAPEKKRSSFRKSLTRGRKTRGKA
jgi:hypothetical protein